jgi:hypothetical protein
MLQVFLDRLLDQKAFIDWIDLSKRNEKNSRLMRMVSHKDKVPIAFYNTDKRWMNNLKSTKSCTRSSRSSKSPRQLERHVIANTAEMRLSNFSGKDKSRIVAS